MKKLLTVFGSAFVLTLAIGCGGHSGGSALDSGEMTLEDYEELQKKSAGSMETMPDNVDQPAK